jgi:hypothetical protein
VPSKNKAMRKRIKKVINFSDYTIDNQGNIYSKEGKPMSQRVNNSGYFIVNLFDNGKHHTKTVHRLVATHFIANPCNKPYINHKDGNKFNNSEDNLEWVTPKENAIHARNNGLLNIPENHSVGEKNPKAKLSEQNVISIRSEWEINENLTVKQLCDKYNVGATCIYDILKRKSWSHI